MQSKRAYAMQETIHPNGKPSRLGASLTAITEATFLLDVVASMRYRDVMPGALEVARKMKQRLEHECRSVSSAKKKLDALAKVYNQIQDLEARIEAGNERIRTIAALLGDDETREILSPDHQQIRDFLSVNRSRIGLWAFVEEYLRLNGRAKVGEIVAFLQALGHENVKRQTIESVVKRNPRDFKAIKEGRDKFIELRK
jgi:hypothetical protein